MNKIPYFETKVVKVKKQPKDSATIYNQCPICKEIHKCNFKKQGNFVNGENIDKIKFPCLCSWNIPLDKDINYGLLIKITNDLYTLYNINKQHSYSLVVGIDNRLKDLIKRWNIHILKGKIIIFEEE